MPAFLLSGAAAGVDTVELVAITASAAGDTAAAPASPRHALLALLLEGNGPDTWAEGEVDVTASALSTAPEALARGAFLRDDPLGWVATGVGTEPETCSTL